MPSGYKKDGSFAGKIFKKGVLPWSNGKTKKDFPQLSNSGVKKGNKPWNKGKKGSQVAWNKGLKGFGEGREHPWMPKGKDHYNWQGGKSFEPYGLEFNNDLKEVIRNRDRRKCFICEISELDTREKLHCHHIDYDKTNNNPSNLISLCRSCHLKTNYHRQNWARYFYGKQ